MLARYATTLFLVSVGLLLSDVARAQTTDATEYFPLRADNEWVFSTIIQPPGQPPDTTITGSIQVREPVTFGEVTYHPIDGLYGTETFFRKDDEGRVWRYFPEVEQEQIWFDFAQPDGGTYQVSDPTNGVLLDVSVVRGLTVDTPAGTFEDCIELFFNAPEVADEELYFTFAPDIGFVRHFGAWAFEVLYTATIDGLVVTSREEQTGPRSPSLLAPGYPNPFHRTTTLHFRLQRPGAVRLTIYDALGRAVEILAAGPRGVGRHTLTWDAAHHPAGVYYAHLQTPALQESVKLVLLK